MSKQIAKGAMNIASDFFTGMAKGAEKGKAFRINGSNKANKTIKSLNAVSAKNISQARRTVPKIASKKSAAAFGKPTVSRKAGNFVAGGMRDTYKNMSKNNMTLGAAARAAHSTNGKLDMKKVAGTYVGASAVARVATGGGVMKDKNGNTNLIGIPFI